MFLDPRKEIQKHLNHLPHWQQPGVMVFLTWRLYDSVPKTLIDDWNRRRDRWFKLHPKPWDEEVEAEYYRTFPTQLEEWLDQGFGSCLLRRPDCRQPLIETLHHSDKDRYDLDCYVLMPNHVHLLVTLNDPLLEKVVGTWKSVSSRKIKKIALTKDAVWQTRYWDRLIRSEEHLWKVRRYIERNPVKAKLRDGEFSFWKKW